MTTKKQAEKVHPWFDRETIVLIVDNMSAADMVKATPDTTISNAERAEAAFNNAAARQGRTNGVAAMELVRARDFGFLAEQMSEVMSPASPKSEAGKDSPDSASTGT